MANYNRIVMIGNLTRDPDYKQLSSGQAICKLSLATNRQFKNKQTGNMVQEVCYIDVEVWGPQAESCRQYLQKGRPVLIEGRLKQDSWQDQSGNNRSKHVIVADRVVFLNTGAAVETSFEQEEESEQRAPAFSLNPNNKVEKDLMDQLERAEKKAKAAKSTPKPKGAALDDEMDPFLEGGDIEFKDEPPFEDELPF